MTGSTAGLITISIVLVIILAASIYLVFYHDTRAAGQREAFSERPMPGQAARQTAEWPEESPELEHGGRRHRQRLGGTREHPPNGPPGPLPAG